MHMRFLSGRDLDAESALREPAANFKSIVLPMIIVSGTSHIFRVWRWLSTAQYIMYIYHRHCTLPLQGHVVLRPVPVFLGTV